MAKKQVSVNLFDTLKKVGEHRQNIGTKAQKQVEKPAPKPSVPKNVNVPAPKITTSAAKAQAQKDAIRRSIDKRITSSNKNSPNTSNK